MAEEIANALPEEKEEKRDIPAFIGELREKGLSDEEILAGFEKGLEDGAFTPEEVEEAKAILEEEKAEEEKAEELFGLEFVD